jgi:hypothetical protein
LNARGCNVGLCYRLHVRAERNPQREHTVRLTDDDTGVSIVAVYVTSGDLVELRSLTFTPPEGRGLKSTDALTFPWRAGQALAQQALLGDEQERGVHIARPRGRHGEYRPDGTDQWWAKFAWYYQRTKEQTTKGSVVKRVSDELGVPTATVQRWSTEARRRGLLPATERTRKDRR